MKTGAIAKSIGKLKGNIRLGWKAHGATITFVGGLVGSVTSGVLGARGWVKAKDIIDEKDNQVTEITSKIGTDVQVSETETRQYTEEDAKKDLSKVRKQAYLGISKAMAPAVVTGGVSVGLLTYSHMNLKGQVSALGAYATAIEGQLANYRVRVANKVGAEEEAMIYQGVRKETVTETVVDPETGETSVKVEEKLVKDADIPVDGVFTFLFDKSWSEWRPNREYNLNMLSIGFSNLTDLMHIYDYIELKDIYNEFGVPIKDRQPCETRVGVVTKGPDSAVEYQVIDYGLDPNDADILFTVKTDGDILEKVKEFRSNKKD